MSTIALTPAIETGETGGLHRTLTTLEAALDYALVKKKKANTRPTPKPGKSPSMPWPKPPTATIRPTSAPPMRN